MYDYYALDTVPYEETPIQAPYGNKHEEAYQEAERFAKMLTERFINLPFGVKFVVKSHPYDTFYYYSVSVRYDPDMLADNEALAFIENNIPATWGDTMVLDFALENGR